MDGTYVEGLACDAAAAKLSKENMSLLCIKTTVNVTAAIAAFLAAGLWWYASFTVVRPSYGKDRDGWKSAQVVIEHESTGPFDPFLTGIQQSRFNKWAAIAAGASALMQGIGLLLP